MSRSRASWQRGRNGAKLLNSWKPGSREADRKGPGTR
jgi:hypothetical protein